MISYTMVYHYVYIYIRVWLSSVAIGNEFFSLLFVIDGLPQTSIAACSSRHDLTSRRLNV